MICKDCQKDIPKKKNGIIIRVVTNGFIDALYTDHFNYCFDCFKAAAGDEMFDELITQPQSYKPLAYNALPPLTQAPKAPKIYKRTFQSNLIPHNCKSCFIAWTPTLFTMVNNLCDNCYNIVFLKSGLGACVCGKNMILRINTIKQTAFWGCSSYPVCKKTTDI